MAKKEWKDLTQKEKIIGVSGLLIIGLIALITSGSPKMNPEEVSKLKVIDNKFKIMTGIFNDVSHIITLKNETGKDIMRLTLKLTYLDKDGKIIQENEQKFNGYPPSSFGTVDKKGFFANGTQIDLTMGEWNRNAYKFSKRDRGLPSTVYLGDDVTKLVKVKTEVLNWEEASEDDKKASNK